jgi:hypothetical protein
MEQVELPTEPSTSDPSLELLQLHGTSTERPEVRLSLGTWEDPSANLKHFLSLFQAYQDLQLRFLSQNLGYEGLQVQMQDTLSVTRLTNLLTFRFTSYLIDSVRVALWSELRQRIYERSFSGFSQEVVDLLQDPAMGEDALIKLSETIRSIDDFLQNMSIDHKITTDIFSDPEYSEWREIKIVVAARGGLDFILRELKPSIYKVARERLPQRLAEQVLITFRTL